MISKKSASITVRNLTKQIEVIDDLTDNFDEYTFKQLKQRYYAVADRLEKICGALQAEIDNVHVDR